MPTSKQQVIEIAGPMPSFAGRTVLFHVTLPSGMIVTSPEGFGTEPAPTPPSQPVVAEDGRVLVRQGSYEVRVGPPGPEVAL